MMTTPQSTESGRRMPGARDGERILVTGGTGFLGAQVVHRLLERVPDARVVLLVRDRSRRGSAILAGELSHLLPGAHAARARLVAVRGDVTEDGCGISKEAYRASIEGTTRVIHAAASVAFDRPEADLRRVNVDGTARVLTLADCLLRDGSLRSVTHVGTAFVAGCRRGLVREDELDVGQRFHNAYERSKCEAEAVVRARWDRLPIAVARPSIVVGDSRGGDTSSFRMIYWPLRVYATGRWRTVPGAPRTVVDLVPVDFVAEAIVSLAFDDQALGRSAHLCAGPARAMTAGEIGALASRVFGQPPPRFLPPLLYSWLIRPIALATGGRGLRRVLREGAVYGPYFDMRMLFDTAVADRLLEPAGLQPPPVAAYLETLFRYCLASDWGRRPVPRDG